MHGRWRLLGLIIALLVGCDEPPVLEDTVEPAAIGQAFDASATGVIRGRVTWDGALPVVEANIVRRISYHAHLHQNPVQYETTHAPRVHPSNQGVADAVVFLRGIDPRRSRPWSHDAVRIEFHDRRLLIKQGDEPTNVGFVRAGDKLTGVNFDADYHALRGRGAGFFTLPLANTGQASSTRLKQAGVVELFDAAGYYWVHAHLFVDEHPYYVRTDSDGNFVLDQVPAGEYELVCWMPSWKLAAQDRDPETALVVRYAWQPPVEQKRPVRVQAGRAQDQAFRWSLGCFGH